MSAEIPDRGQAILVIDDNAPNRQLAEAHLIAAGYTVTLAEGGEQGIAAFQQATPDLVLLDILMPDMDGYETCRRLKALSTGKDVPVVFLTALGDLGSHQKALESGADDFLTKPIHRTELLIRVRSLLWVKRLRDELSKGYDVIRQQRDALVRAQQQKAELSALVVHDLKNPLASILTNARFLLAGARLAGDERDAARDVVTAAEVMHRMVMDLLDISRSEDGTLVPRPVDIDLRALIDEVCATVKRRCDEQNVRITAVVDVGVIRADKDLLHRLIENLLDNGIKYAPSGGVLRIGVERADDHHIDIRVSDEGPGVPDADREKIFETYAQLDRDAEAHPRSSRGLGLAFCHLAAEAHGGRIWVEENKPKGSSFCVRLPVDTP